MNPFLKYTTLGTAAITILLAYSLPEYLNEITAGMLLPWISAVSGYFLVERNLFRSRTSFMLLAFQYVGVRLLFMLAMFTYLIIYINLDTGAFIFTLFISYIYNSIPEIFFLQRLKPKTDSEP